MAASLRRVGPLANPRPSRPARRAGGPPWTSSAGTSKTSARRFPSWYAPAMRWRPARSSTDDVNIEQPVAEDWSSTRLTRDTPMGLSA